MKNNTMLHERETTEETESFLKQNGKKFQGDCLTAMRLMFAGHKLTSQDCWEKYKIHDRRLRNCHSARPDIVKKQWVMKSNGTRSHVEYWIEKFPQPTKEATVEKALRYIKGEKNASDYARELINGAKHNLLNQANLF